MSKEGPKRQKKFSQDWLEDEEFKSWLKAVPGDELKYRCSICRKTNSLSSSGRGALTDHARGGKHIEAVKKIANFFQPSPAAQQRKLDQLETLSEEEKVKAQILWLMKSINSGFSNNATDDVGDVLRRMDPNSKVLAAFNMKKTKAAYIINHGLAPYYRDLLYEQINVTDVVVLSFDESHNDVIKKGEMVLMVRYWCSSENMVKVRYLDSTFLGHAKENDLLVHFNKMCSKLDRSKIFHISLDGPNVNHSFMRSLKRDWENQMMHKLLDIGVCNLHIVSGAFKTGALATDWMIHKTLKGAYQMFHEAPARREDYALVTKSEKFPQFFSATRWVENQEPADRLIEIWPNIQKLWTWWTQQKPKSKQPCSLQTKTMLHMKEALVDDLQVIKLHFFSFVAGKLQPFLIRYQADKPMIPYLYRDLETLLRILFLLIAKKSVVDDALVAGSLTTIDLNDEKNLLKLKNVEIGFAAEHKLNEMRVKDLISKTAEKNFRNQCVKFIRAMLLKIMERSPIESMLLKCASVFDPQQLAKVKKETLTKSLKALLSVLVKHSIIDISKGDKVLQEFGAFYDEDVSAKLTFFQDYSEKDQRLDTFFFSDLKVGEKYTNMSFVLRLILTMSHGQSSVERDFSLKNNLEQDNQSEMTTVSRRMCKDYMVANKIKPSEIKVDKCLLKSVQSARRRYDDYLKEEAQKKKPVNETVELIAAKKKKEEIDQVERDILLISAGVKEADTAVREAGKALEVLCGKKKASKEGLLSINAKMSGNLKRKAELETELDILKKKKKDLES